MKNLTKVAGTILLFSFCIQSSFGQASQTDETIKVDSVKTDTAAIPFNIIENVPIYPGCETLESNDERKRCMSKKIARSVNRNFNTDLANELGLTGKQRIIVTFVIDQQGKVTNIKAQANHPRLETEAQRVVAKLPIFIPATHKGKNVSVKYSLPITFVIVD